MTIAEQVIELNFEDENGHVRVIPPDRSVMAMPVKMAIEACRAYNEQYDFSNQFDHLLDYLGKWISLHSDQVKEAFITSRDSGLLFLVIQSGSEYSREFEDELTELDINIANDEGFNLIDFDVLAMPNVDQSSIDSFIKPKATLKYRTNG